MITTALINLAYYLLSIVLDSFPAGSGFPTQVHTAATALGGYVGIFSDLVPLDTMLTVVTLAFTLEITLFGFRTVKWLLSYIPFIGGRG